MRFSIKNPTADRFQTHMAPPGQNDMRFELPGTVHEEVEHYDGEYDVTPLITAQTLHTKDKMMDDNVRVDMIPTHEIPNAAGGVTFIVGGLNYGI